MSQVQNKNYAQQMSALLAFFNVFSRPDYFETEYLPAVRRSEIYIKKICLCDDTWYYFNVPSLLVSIELSYDTVLG